jgi:transposase
MKGFHLTKEQISQLRTVHREAKCKSAAYKINAVILLGSGWTLIKVKDALLIDDETLRNYVASYREGGIAGLVKTNYQGRQSYMTNDELKLLCNELDTEIYLTTKEVADFVNSKFNRRICRELRSVHAK